MIPKVRSLAFALCLLACSALFAQVYSLAPAPQYLDASGKVQNGIRYANQFSSIHAAINDFGGPGACGIVYIPQGTYTDNIIINTSNTCTNPSNQLIIRGAGRRNTIIKPASNACVLTIDSTAGPVQGVTVEDLSFDNTGTGFSGANNNAICITGTNINDQHLFRRLFIQGGFYRNFNITGRCLNCAVRETEINGGKDDSFYFSQTSNSAGGGSFTFDRVTIDGSATAKRCLYINSGPETTGNVAIRDSDFQNCGQEGANLNNIDGLEISNTDFEANGSTGIYDNILLGGAYMRGFHIHGNHLLNSTNGNAIEITATQVGGSIEGNFLASGSNNTLKQSGASSGVVNYFGNWEAYSGTPHSTTADANANYHVVFGNNYLTNTVSSKGSITPSVAGGVNAIRMTNSTATAITNFTGGEAGQVVTVFQEGSGNITLTHSGTGGLFMPEGASVTLIGNESATFYYSPYNTRWVLTSITGPSVVRTLRVGSSGSTITDSRQLAQFPASLTTTAATSDNVSIKGVTASSHCSLTATNASAATNIATTYVSAKTTNQITVTHTATGSMNYDILCTAN